MDTDDICPITLEPISQIPVVYVNDVGRKFDAYALYEYFTTARTLRDPLTRVVFTLDDVMRLESMVGKSELMQMIKRSVFTDSLAEICTVVLLGLSGIIDHCQKTLSPISANPQDLHVARVLYFNLCMLEADGMAPHLTPLYKERLYNVNVESMPSGSNVGELRCALNLSYTAITGPVLRFVQSQTLRDATILEETEEGFEVRARGDLVSQFLETV